MNVEQVMDVRRRVYGEVNEAREALGDLEALSSRDDLDEVYAYLDNVERVVRAGLLTMDPTWTGDRAHLGVGIARAIAAINVFEGSIPAEEG
ncbi:MAG: hypothetical protein M3Q49_10495 [Actinomycetota bacterium]|nr:hypothetical protein [Actinomycetota bacterium]